MATRNKDNETKNKIQILQAKKQSLFSMLQSLYNLSEQVDEEIKRDLFLIRIQSLENTRREYTEVTDQLNITMLSCDSEYEPDFKDLCAFDELYCQIKSIQAGLTKIEKQKPQLGNYEKINRKLPTLELKGFDGSPNQWVLFYENFNSLIHKNPHLSNAEKVQYLIGKLSGKAALICAGIPPIADNYEILWKSLKEKYQDKRTLATLYLEQILNFRGSQTPSQNALDTFLEKFYTAFSAMKQLQLDDLADFTFTHIALSKLDKETVLLFEQAKRQENIPTFESLITFVKEQNRIYTLRNAGSSQTNFTSNYKSSTSQVNKNYNKKQSYSAQSFVVNNSFPKCSFCKDDNAHPLYKCDKFLLLNSHHRNDFVKNNNLCFNCLGFHSVKKCKSKNRCATCQRMHHTKLHMESSMRNLSSNVNTSPSPAPQHPSVVSASPLSMHSNVACNQMRPSSFKSIIMLPTAVVYAYDDSGKRFKIRALLDSGSTSHFITKPCCERLKLRIINSPATVRGIGNSEKSLYGFANLTIYSRFDARCRFQINARVISTISDKVPNAFVIINDLQHLHGLPLADEIYHTPADIDLLISNELFPFLLGDRKAISPNSTAVGIQTSLGYVIMGKADCVVQPVVKERALHAMVDEPSLENLTQRFWELENVPIKNHLSPDDAACERIFTKTFTRNATGRYTVTLPFKCEPTELGRSDTIAKTRFLQLEKRLESNPDLRKDYNETIKGYIEKGYINSIDNLAPGPSYYMPHHAVYRPEKVTSRTRVVVNASCKSSSNKSLNDILYTGSNLQANIFELLINLRLFPIALSADIEKMYFQVKLKPEHHRFQRILFRFHPSDPLQTYEFNRVCFGVSSSPYLAMRVIKQLAEDERSRWPAAAWAAERHFYMDDYVSSVDTVDNAYQLHRDLVQLFKSGGFHLGKWISNSTELMEKIPADFKSPKLVQFNEEAYTQIVGLRWNPSDDVFLFKINADLCHSDRCTKRIILSATARLFDPLSLLGPVTALLKLLVQECWKQNLDWDENAPAYIESQWQQFKSELYLLERLKIPRHVGISQSYSNVELIGFADASEKCYGAVLYIRVSNNDDEAQVTLLCAKSRVASPKCVSLARLELCAALLLSNLIACVQDTIRERVHVNKILAFTDSTVTLAWIRAAPYKFKTFVANRIAAINENLSAEQWFHVPGVQNPADIISRPVMPSTLLENNIYYHGPSWLACPRQEWPINLFDAASSNEELPEAKTVSLLVQSNSDVQDDVLYKLADRMSSYLKFLRVSAYVLRFSKRLSTCGSISAKDLELTETFVLKRIQRHHTLEIDSRTLRKLNAYLDDVNIIRVGGRLNQSQLSSTQKHPIVLPAKDRIVHLLVDSYHKKNLHAGASLLLALLRQNFWILSARNMIRKRVQHCNTCFKTNPANTYPLMGDLPHYRVSEVKSFVFTGVDYGGPFFVTPYRRRGVKPTKAYLCLFICLTTKALHLELVSDLSSEMFLNAFKRFISRRGPVSLIVSDGGTNFVGAKRKLDELYTFLQSDAHTKYLDQSISNLRIQFKQNPPYAPHFGGIWESNIKAVKTHLKRVVGSQILTYEELNTVIVQIEGLMNSRPLCVLSSDPAELTALTPAHFLNVTPLRYLPSEDFSDVQENRLNRYELLHKLVQSYWKRWSQEYLTSLQSRQKWNTPSKPVERGSVVIIREDNSPPLSWPLAVIEELYPGKDGVIRTVKVRTQTGEYVRPVVRLCPLPLQ